MIAIGVEACISHTAKGPMPTDRKLIEASRTWQIYLAYPCQASSRSGRATRTDGSHPQSATVQELAVMMGYGLKYLLIQRMI